MKKASNIAAALTTTMAAPSRNTTADFIQTPEGIKSFVNHVVSRGANAQPFLYIDLEGQRLSRNGTISLLTVLETLGAELQCLFIIDSLTFKVQPSPQSVATVTL